METGQPTEPRADPGASDLASPVPISFSLRMKLVSLIATIVIVTGVLLVGYNFNRSRASLETELRKRGQVIAQNLADAARPLLVAGSSALRDLCASFAEQGDIAYVLIADTKGEVVTRFVTERSKGTDDAFVAARAHRAAANPSAAVISVHTSDGEELYAVTAPILIDVSKADEGDEAILGIESALAGQPKAEAHGRSKPSERKVEAVVEVGVSLAGLFSVERELLAAGVVIIGLVVLLGLFSGLLVAGLVVRPIALVAAASDAIASGDLTVRLPTRARGDEINTLAVFFNRMAVVLQRQRNELVALTNELTQQRDHERALRDVAMMINAAQGVTGLIEGLLTRISEQVGAHACVFYTVDEAKLRLVPNGTFGLAGAKVGSIAFGEGFAGRAAKLKKRVVGDQVPFLTVPALGQELRPSSVAAIPVVFQERLLAVVEIGTFGSFSEAHLSFLDGLAEQGAVALVNLLSHERTVELAQELAKHKVELENQNLELARANEEIQKANEHKSAFLANMSHELRTPLNSIIGFTRLVLKKSGEVLPKLQRENLQKVEKSAGNLLGIINDLLDISKIEAGRLDVVTEPFQLAELLEEVLATAAPLVGDKAIQVTHVIPADLPEMNTDRTRLRQIVLNLVSNAIKFTPAGRVTLQVAYNRELDRIRIDCVDTGVGISESDRRRLFEPFRQLDNSTTRKVGGTGLGLVIVKRLCELLGGKITLESQVGLGSTFSVDLPRRISSRSHEGGKPDSTPSKPPPVPTPARGAPIAAGSVTLREPSAPGAAPVVVATATRPTILVIDDNMDDATLLREMLSEQGFDVAVAFDGAEGIRLARELRPALITVDIQMPGLDGWMVIRELRADPRTKDLPIVVASIIALEGQAQGRELGARAFVSKPFSARALRNVLAKELVH